MLLALNIIVQFSYNQLNIQFYIVAMDTLCCMGLTIASRMISTYTLAFSILLINVFTSHLLTKTQKSEFFKILDSWSPVGLSWTFIFKYIQLDNQFEIIAISCTVIILYSSLFFVTSGYLAYGSTVVSI
ncbi:hypothetical protein M0802_001271 [Mischocyttarus mexicanus]|nr:hypothetical protein M0802_001271 [Mischocyttarus mexicanus]